jgi:hypothetical protein
MKPLLVVPMNKEQAMSLVTVLYDTNATSRFACLEEVMNGIAKFLKVNPQDLY